MEKLIHELENNFYSFDILQLIQVIEEVLDDSGGGRVFFESDPSLAFPSSDVGFVKVSGCGDDGRKDSQDGDDDEAEIDRRASISMPMMNLLGSSSPLPVTFSDYITRGRSDAEMYQGFLSIMQNRLHSLWLDAHQKYSLWSNTGKVARRIFESMTALPPSQMEFYGGALSQLDTFSRGTRSSSDLKLLLRSTWKDIPVRIDENVERWTSVDNRHAPGGGLRLGLGAVAGSKIYDRTSKFRIVLGPLEYHLYRTFLPGEANYEFLRKILALFINEPLICELEISCERNDLPPARLGDGEGSVGRTAALGRSSRKEAHRYRTIIPS